MPTMNDMVLLREYADGQSESAFSELVSRHINLVYSAALRQLSDPHLAQEVTQAVFIILARKSGILPQNTVLSGWLLKTTRYEAYSQIRSAMRRAQREQEAYMQSTLNESDDAAWEKIAPLLDEAMAALGETDRNAIALRFFENKTASEIATTLQMNEQAVQKRVTRALEKMRKFLAKRSVVCSAMAIASAASANAVQAAPVGLAKTVSAVAVVKGAAAGGSTLTVTKGVLKIMAWTKTKMAITAGVAVLLATGTTVVLQNAIMHMNSVLKQTMPDGSTLVLNQICADKFTSYYGGKTNTWKIPGWMVLEFCLISEAPENHPLVKTAFFRQYRGVLRGEHGIEYVQELHQFQKVSDGYSGYIQTDTIPRDSRWLWLRIEKREDYKRYDSWQPVAEFKFANPTRSANHKWIASTTPSTNVVDGKNIVLGEIVIKIVPNYTNDIWNHIVTVPAELREGDVVLTNWAAVYTKAEDASGNGRHLVRYDRNSRVILQHHRSLDPRCVWKLDMDFEPISNFSEQNLATVVFVEPTAKITTNVMGVPVEISWSNVYSKWGNPYITASIPTNRTDLGLQFVSMQDDQGKDLPYNSAGWNPHGFSRSMEITDSKQVKVTVAVVPNVHTTFYTQPRIESAKN